MNILHVTVFHAIKFRTTKKIIKIFSFLYLFFLLIFKYEYINVLSHCVNNQYLIYICMYA